METLNPTHPKTAMSETAGEFQIGEELIYAMHGKCAVSGIETRNVANQSIRFYKLEVRKSALSRSVRQEPAIWVPVAKARELGLRARTTAADLDALQAIFTSREYYLDASLPWNTAQPKLEEMIRNEGAIGLAKALSYLFVQRNRHVVPPTEVNKLYESVGKLLFREISEITGESLRAIEERVAKVMRPKLRPDH